MRIWLTASILLAILAGLVLGMTVVVRPDLRDRALAALLGGEPQLEPVLLIVVGHRQTVTTLYDTVEAETIVHRDEDSFALASGHIVASRVESASAALNALGWGDRPLDIVDPRRIALRPASIYGSRKLDLRTHPDDGGPSLAELAVQPSLTESEALRALRMMR